MYLQCRRFASPHVLVKHSGLSAIAGGQDNKETPVALLPRSPTIALLYHRMSFNCQCS